MAPILSIRKTNDSIVSVLPSGRWHLEISEGGNKAYRWAQLDDYMDLKRGDFFWKAPVFLSLRARVSANNLPGTWGFGFWNDPFASSYGIGGAHRYLPTLPNSAWFFYASTSCYLSLRDDQGANGFLASAFSSKPLIPKNFIFLLPFLPLIIFPGMAKCLRKKMRRIIDDNAQRIDIDTTTWHAYAIKCHCDFVRYYIDGNEIFKSPVVPKGRLGLVLWIDNQFAAYSPDGSIRFGVQSNPESAWLELENIMVNGYDFST